MLKQAKPQGLDDPAGLVSDEFSELDVLDDSNSMYMVRFRTAPGERSLVLADCYTTW